MPLPEKQGVGSSILPLATMNDSNFDIHNKYFDEPHPPIDLEKNNLNLGKFLSENHGENYLMYMKFINSLRDCNSILEVGPGEGYIRDNFLKLGKEYDTIDIVDDFSPTYLCDFLDFDPLSTDKRYDLTAAFQVLEHFEFSKFDENIKKLSEMSKKYIFISLPYSCIGFTLKFTLQISQTKRIKKNLKIYLRSFKANRKYRNEYKSRYPWAVHYFEIGRRGYPLKKILKIFSNNNLKIISRTHGDNPYHYLILLEKIT